MSTWGEGKSEGLSAVGDGRANAGQYHLLTVKLCESLWTQGEQVEEFGPELKGSDQKLGVYGLGHIFSCLCPVSTFPLTSPPG